MHEEMDASHRWIATSLLEDSSLRSELDDEQASRLLRWGLDHIGERARKLAYLPAAAFHAQLEAYGTQVRQLMHDVNALARPVTLAPSDADDQVVARLIETLKHVGGEDLLPAFVGDQVRQLLRQRQALPAAAFCDLLIDLLVEER